MAKPENTSQANNTEDVLDSTTIRCILKKTAEDIPSPSPTIFARIEQSLDHTTGADNREQPSSSFVQNFIRRLHNYFNKPELAWGIVAIEALVLCIFLAFSPIRPPYQTLSSDQTVVQSTGAPSFYVKFKNNATMQEIENLLIHINATIINGPGKQGIYTIKLSQPSTPKHTDNILQSLKKSPTITFAGKAY